MCITVVFAGTGSALHPRRGQSSVIVETPVGVLAVDLGCTALNTASAAGVDVSELDLVVVTHSHYDHLCGVPHLAFLRSFKGGGRLYLAGEPEAVMQAARLAGMAASGPHRVEASTRGALEAARRGLRLSLIEAVHTVPAVGVVVEHGGVRVVVSGDTRPTKAFAEAASGAALAVHEATFPDGMEERARETGHSTVGEALAQLAPAELGALYHLTPQSEASIPPRGGGRVIVPTDGLRLRLC